MAVSRETNPLKSRNPPVFYLVRQAPPHGVIPGVSAAHKQAGAVNVSTTCVSGLVSLAYRCNLEIYRSLFVLFFLLPDLNVLDE